MPSPLVTFDWDTFVIRKAGPDPLIKSLRYLRNSEVPRSGHFQLRNAIINGIRGLAGTLPRHWWLWAACFRQFRISETMTRGRTYDTGPPSTTWKLRRPLASGRGNKGAGGHLVCNPGFPRG